ncbi:membrane protein [Bordetella ansorpii]|uniref:Membrane protein n=1 Tax=Bordetella ansorpii TaxID=288768 RepID=A0A157PZZ4_9BORD|nr:hypothetical protein [Bordetella ansorpii]SAI39127.1 membrane protein [Bordetella ansorpii]
MALTFKPVGEPGQAELSLTEWRGDASRIELSLRSNASQNNHLDPKTRGWSGTPQWIVLTNGQVRGEELMFRVQADIVDPLLTAARKHSFQAYERDASGEEVRHRVRIEQGIQLSSAVGKTVTAPEPVPVASAPVPPVEPVIDAPPVTRPDPRPETVSLPRKSALPWVIAGGAVLLIAAAAAAYFLMRGAPAAEAPAAAPAVSAASGCTKEALADASAMSFVQECVRQVTDSAGLLAIIHAARDAGKCEIAQRLYANRANAGDVVIAQSYAREYDPAFHKENACFKPEAATARYWYESVLEKDPQNAEAKARLQALPQ